MGFLSRFFNKDKEEDKESAVDKTVSFAVDSSNEKPVKEEVGDEIDLPNETVVKESDINKNKDIDINV